MCRTCVNCVSLERKIRQRTALVFFIISWINKGSVWLGCGMCHKFLRGENFSYDFFFRMNQQSFFFFFFKYIFFSSTVYILYLSNIYICMCVCNNNLHSASCIVHSCKCSCAYEAVLCACRHVIFLLWHIEKTRY